jgi:hypothetical protein
MTLRKNFVTFLVAISIALVMAMSALAQEHATEGVITHVDSGAKTVAVKTADGTEDVFKYSGNTAVHAAKGTKTGAADTYLAGKEGSHVVVRYTEKGSDKTAVAIDDVGKGTTKVGEGVVTGVDKAGRTVTVKTAQGSQEVYHVGKDAIVDTGHGVISGTEFAAKKGEKVSVHYTEEAGRKIAHFITHP